MQISDAFPSKYISAPDLKDKDHTLVIADVKNETMTDGRLKPVLYFQNAKKGMVLNKTNAGRIAYLYGDDTDDWTGKEIVLTSEFVEFQGKSVKAIRVKSPSKKGAATKQVVANHGAFTTSTSEPTTEPYDDDEVAF
jgi:hypothetical protein